MGNNKNLKWSHICRGKYVKRVVPKTKNSNKLYHNGSRIINLNKLKKHLQVVTRHAATCQACADNALSGNNAIILTGEQNNNGLCSVLTSHCAGCHTDFKFSTSSRIKGMSGGRYWECNLAAVWGQMVTGGGHAPLTESMAVLGVPSLTKKAFMTIEKQIGRLFLKSQCNKLVPKKKPLLFPMKGTTRESQQSQSLLMGAGVNAPINTLIMQSLGWA